MALFPLILKRTQKIVETSKPLYFYCQNPYGVTKRKPPASAVEIIRNLIHRYDIAKDWVPETRPLILRNIVLLGVSAFSWLNRANYQQYGKDYDDIQKFFREHKDEIVKSERIDKIRKISAKLIISGHTFPFRIFSAHIFRPFLSVLSKFARRRKELNDLQKS